MWTTSSDCSFELYLHIYMSSSYALLPTSYSTFLPGEHWNFNIAWLSDLQFLCKFHAKVFHEYLKRICAHVGFTELCRLPIEIFIKKTDMLKQLNILIYRVSAVLAFRVTFWRPSGTNFLTSVDLANWLLDIYKVIMSMYSTKSNSY